MAHANSVLDVMHRKSIPAEAIQHVVDEIARQFSPQRIVLFGSYAGGNPRPESDVDLLVVMATLDEGQQSLMIRQAIPCEFGLDLVVRTHESLKQRIEWGDFFLKDVLAQGKVVYESAHG